MDVYITFYSVFPKNRIYLYNGFSFGRNKDTDKIDLFIADNASTDEILYNVKKFNPQRVWCSVSMFSHFLKIADIADEKWIVGGPITRKDYFNKNFKFLCVRTSMEEFCGCSKLSNDFDFYFDKFIDGLSNSKIMYSLSLGYGCYWSKCRFCSYKKFSGNGIVIRDVDKLFSSVPETKRGTNKLILHTCIDSLPASVLEKVLSGYYNVNSFASYIRADKDVISVFEEYRRDLSDFTFSIGLESFSQSIINKMNKGILIDDVIKLLRIVLDEGAIVYLSVLGWLPFITSNDVKESVYNIDIISNLQKISDKLFLIYNDKVYWPDLEVLQEYEFPIIKHELDGYVIEISEDCPQYNYSKIIEEKILTSFRRIVRGA